MCFASAYLGGIDMEANFLTHRSRGKLFSLGIYSFLLGLSVSVTPMAVVGADEVQQAESQLEQVADSSVEEDDFLQLVDQGSDGANQGKKSYTIDLLCHGKGPKNKGTEQSNADASTEGKSVKREGCDIDPLEDKKEAATAEPKKADSTLLNVSLFGLVAAVVGFVFVKKMKKG
jgi:hypothetical protein